MRTFSSHPPSRARRGSRPFAVMVVATTLIVPGLGACSNDKAPDTTAAAAAATEGAAVPTEAVAASPTPVATDAAGAPIAADLTAMKGKNVVYLINGALGDKGFYDSGQLGMDTLKAAGAQTRTLEANFDASKYQNLVDAAFADADIVFAIAYGFEDALKTAAKAYPDTPVVNLDFDIGDADGNVTSVDFIEEESAFLAGAAAALATTETSIAGINAEKKIGVVGGDSDPVTTSFMFAYENGAKAIDPAISVERKTLGGAWDDQAKGKQAAEQLYDSGNDVVFQVAAAAGLGVLQAASDRKQFAIGVDANQNDLYPGHVFASDIKNVGGAIERVAKSIVDGSFKKGTVVTLGIKDGGVDLDLTATTKVLPAVLEARIAALRLQIIDGKLEVERYRP